MKKSLGSFLIIPVIAGVFFYSCGGNGNGDTELRKANGPVHYGGVFKFNEVESFRSLYPLNVTEEVAWHICSQIYEGLVKFDQKTLEPKAALATKWDIQDSGKKYLFTLRQGVVFHDNACFTDGKGRAVTAKDVKWCLDRLCESSPVNKLFDNTFKGRVVGASEYFQSTLDKKPLSGGVSGVKVVNDSTLEVDLVHPHPSFLSILCTPGCWVYPKEAWDKYGEAGMRTNCVGTGPFMVESLKEGEAVLLQRNKNYYMKDQYGNQLPYLDKIRVSFQKDRNQEVVSFDQGDLDMVYRVPVEMIPKYMGPLSQAKSGGGQWDLQSDTAMSVTYYGFQNMKAPFDNVKVRQAFCYALNRDLIATTSLKGDVVPGSNGVVPPSIPGYGATSIGYTYDETKAKQLLADAGYPGGKGFPSVTLQINLGGADRNKIVADAVRNQLNNVLGIDIKVESLPQGQALDAIESGKSMFWRYGWIADYPDAENFLALLYGKNKPASLNEQAYLNTVRYDNPRFDSIFELSMKEGDPAKRNELYHQAERIALDDAPLCPIYYEINDRLIQKFVTGFDINAMEYRDLTNVWFDPSKMKK